MPLIVGIGEALWDVYPEGAHFGGAPANFVLHVQSLGGRVALVTSLGLDKRGEQARELLEVRGVDLAHVQMHSTRATGEVRITLNEQATPRYEFVAEPAWAELASTREQDELARECGVVCFGTLGQSSASSRETIQRFLRACSSESIRLLDLNLRGEYWSLELVGESLELASALKCNEDEVVVLGQVMGMAGFSSYDILREALLRYDLEFVIFTQGEGGSLVMTRDEEDFQEAEPVAVVDTTGAGDSFLAAFVMAWLAEWSLSDSHRCASRVAGYVCSKQGAAPELPSKFCEKVEVK